MKVILFLIKYIIRKIDNTFNIEIYLYIEIVIKPYNISKLIINGTNTGILNDKIRSINFYIQKQN